MFLCDAISRLSFSIKQKQSVGNTLDKIVSSYEEVYRGQLDEDVVLSKCRNAISCVEKVEKEIGGGISSGSFHGSSFFLLSGSFRYFLMGVLLLL